MIHLQQCDKQVLICAGAPVTVFEEFVAGYGQSSNQQDELLEVHLPILVLIQVVHDLLHHHGVLAGLKQKHTNSISCQTRLHGVSS